MVSYREVFSIPTLWKSRILDFKRIFSTFADVSFSSFFITEYIRVSLIATVPCKTCVFWLIDIVKNAYSTVSDRLSYYKMVNFLTKIAHISVRPKIDLRDVIIWIASYSPPLP